MNKEFNKLKEKLAEKYHDQIDLIIKEEFMKDYEELLNAAKKC